MQGRLLFWFVCLHGAGEGTRCNPLQAWETPKQLVAFAPGVIRVEKEAVSMKHKPYLSFHSGDRRNELLKETAFFPSSFDSEKSVSSLGALCG